MEIENNQKVTLADGNDLEITLNPRDLEGPTTLVYVEIISSASGIYVASGMAVNTSKHYARPTGSAFPIRYKELTSYLKIRGTAADTIVFSW